MNFPFATISREKRRLSSIACGHILTLYSCQREIPVRFFCCCQEYEGYNLTSTLLMCTTLSYKLLRLCRPVNTLSDILDSIMGMGPEQEACTTSGTHNCGYTVLWSICGASRRRCVKSRSRSYCVNLWWKHDYSCTEHIPFGEMDMQILSRPSSSTKLAMGSRDEM